MKIYRHNALWFAAACLMQSSMFAQQPPPKPPSPAERLQKMKADLNLSEDQVKKLKPILEANMEKMKALHENSSLSEEQKREKSHEVRKQGGDAIMEVLTPEQKTKFEEEIKKHRKNGPPGGGPGGDGPRKAPPEGGRPGAGGASGAK